MITFLDVETMFQINPETKRSDPSPFHKDNKLVSVQYALDDAEPIFKWFYHQDKDIDPRVNHAAVQNVLHNTKLLVGHNIKFDLMWLWEAGFVYDGPVYDTMIAEYLLLRCQKWGVSLADSCARRKVAMKKGDLVQDYLSNGIGFDRMPPETVEEYGIADIVSTRELFFAHRELFSRNSNAALRQHLKLMNNFLPVLATIEQNGIKIDFTEMHKVKSDYQIEKSQLQMTMEDICHTVMGDRRINFASPEQLSQLIYSRRITDKKKWAEAFNIGLNEKGKPLLRPRMSIAQFALKVKDMTTRIHKTRAEQCGNCKGKGDYYKIRKDGSLWKNPTRCKTCGGDGYVQIPLPKVGGLTMNPSGVMDVSASGFATDKTTLARLLSAAVHKGNENAANFLKATIRLNAVDVYLSSFIGGIARNVKQNGILHPRFNQCVTRTTRLSSSDPNFQNQPRGNTFPVRAVVISRFEGGSILQADYSQLEFRVAAQLCGDEQMLKDILDGVDVHKYTASVIFQKSEDDVTKDERTAAKAHTFKPLYGGMSGTPNEVEYYKAFVQKYPSLGKWHDDLQTEAITHGIVSLHTGQQFAFPDTKRLPSGAASNAPSIKNYPVQGLAGGCVVPLALISLHNELRNQECKSIVINTVHDSIVLDVYPGEEQKVARITYDAMKHVDKAFEEVYNVKWNVPLEVDLEIGKNWLDMQSFVLD
jgi:DNA polymerase I-like protein with 3'-5' exonuclease and polymerase domains